MNDPNGLVWLSGTWHLFFQYNPYGADWGNMSWGHAVSDDLATWQELPPALAASDSEAVFSGSVVLDSADTSGLGNGSPPLVAVYTSVAPDGVQAQSLAVSHDLGGTWTRYPRNPVLDRGSTGFRDPKVFRYQPEGQPGWWVMVAVEATEERVLIYRSDDLRRWSEVSEVRASVAERVLWECPDLFPLEVEDSPGETAWVLVVSVNPGGPAGGSGTRYQLGQFDGERFRAADREGWRWLDYGHDMYAAVSFAEAPEGRRVVVGWMSNWAYADAVPTTPWRGAMTLPRELALERRADQLTLVQYVPAEIDVWRADSHAQRRVGALVAGVVDLGRASHARIELDLEPLGADTLGLELFAGPMARTVLSYDVRDQRLTLDRSRSGATDFHPMYAGTPSRARVPLRSGRLRLVIFLDACSVEVFADAGAVTITDLVLPEPGADRVALFTGGGSVRIHQLDVQLFPGASTSGAVTDVLLA